MCCTVRQFRMVGVGWGWWGCRLLLWKRVLLMGERKREGEGWRKNSLSGRVCARSHWWLGRAWEFKAGHEWRDLLKAWEYKVEGGWTSWNILSDKQSDVIKKDMSSFPLFFSLVTCNVQLFNLSLKEASALIAQLWPIPVYTSPTVMFFPLNLFLCWPAA